MLEICFRHTYLRCATTSLQQVLHSGHWTSVANARAKNAEIEQGTTALLQICVYLHGNGQQPRRYTQPWYTLSQKVEVKLFPTFFCFYSI